LHNKKDMKDICLVSVNWNARNALELLLKSYVKHHYEGTPLKVLIADNASDDGSRGFLFENEIPFISFDKNIGHENALNEIYTKVKAKYCLLNDTDIEYKDNVFSYIKCMDDEFISVGELIDKNVMNDIKIQDRISPWFQLFRIDKMWDKGIKVFRDPSCENWTYDVGSWHWEQMKNCGYQNINLTRRGGNQDSDLISMRYDKFDHIGKVSWDIFGKHQDRIDEVSRRREYIKIRLEQYEDIDLKKKFV